VFRIEPAKVLAFAKQPHAQTKYRFTDRWKCRRPICRAVLPGRVQPGPLPQPSASSAAVGFGPAAVVRDDDSPAGGGRRPSTRRPWWRA